MINFLKKSIVLFFAVFTGMKYARDMDLRNYFAAKAMQAMINQCNGSNFDDFVIAQQAYQMADFMIKERTIKYD